MRRIILSLFAISLIICPSYARDIDVKEVEGTSLAELSDAFEVLRRFSSVTVIDDHFDIAGKGKAVIFVDGRRLDRHIDLKMIPASSVKKIEVVSEARLEYDNIDGVILVSLIKAAQDEFNLMDIAEMTVSPFLGGSNDLEISGRKNKLIYEGGLAVAYTGTSDVENRTIDTYTQIPEKSGLWLNERKVQDFNDINKELSVAAKTSLGWEINPDHLLGVRLEYDYLKSSGDRDDLRDKLFTRKGSSIDLVNPSSVFPATSVTNSRKQDGKLNLSYQGKVNEWKVTANLDFNLIWYKGRDTDHESPEGKSECVSDFDYLISSGDSYLRFNASHPLWKGDVIFGASLDTYFHNNRMVNFCEDNSLIHSDLFNIIPGAFVSLKQSFGVVNMDFGLHYQHYYVTYTPLEDDSTRARIEELIGQPKITYIDWLLHPHLTLSVPIDKATLSAGVQILTDFPQFSSLSIRIDELRRGDLSDAFAFVDRRDEFFLKGEWEWIQLKGWATHNIRPLFTDVDVDNDFNGPDYWGMDWKLSLTPSVGIWETGLTATLHKQWINMESLHPYDDLSTPMATFNWVNSFSLPWGMRIDLTAMLRTKGAEANIYHRNAFFSTDLAIQQPFLKGRLVVGLYADNLFRTSQVNAFYTKVSSKEFVWNDRLDYRMFKLSVKFTL